MLAAPRYTGFSHDQSLALIHAYAEWNKMCHTQLEETAIKDFNKLADTLSMDKLDRNNYGDVVRSTGR